MASGAVAPDHQHYLSPFDAFKSLVDKSNYIGDLYLDNRYGLGFIERLHSDALSLLASPSIKLKSPVDTSFVLYIDPYFNQGTLLTTQYGLLSFDVLDFEVYGLPLPSAVHPSGHFVEYEQWLNSFSDSNFFTNETSFISKRKSLLFS